MRTTALQAAALAVLSSPAAAQIAASTRPTGGQVTAGQASIGGTGATTLITQKSENAAINWQTYNIGSAQTVRYAQPNAAAITLNTVVAPSPSLILGKIVANGQIIIVNQSGVVFAKGAQVDTAGLVVSSAGISQKDFMAGRLVFSQAGRPGAAISNAGNITIRQAGLAALVAPQVANAGVISAKLGRVVLGGAATHTIDLYGDGLETLNITGQVTQVSLNGKTVPALVTNTGTILAPGGTVVLTAAAADNVVTNLVSAGGTIGAASLGGQTGRVLVQGIGGGVSIDGAVSATGAAAGTKGGQVVVNATGDITVAPGAVIDASGKAGGGVVAVGTTAARAIGGPAVHPALTARTVSLAAGARLRADATGSGQGGRVTVLSTETTSQAGAITATGAGSGNGGWIEVSGKNLALGGLIDDSAAHGKPGSILLDPANILVGSLSGTGSSGSTLVISPGSLDQLRGNVILDAAGSLTVNEQVNLSSRLVKTFQLEGDAGIFIDAPINTPGIAVALKSATGSITENASGSITASSISATASGVISLSSQTVSTVIAPFTSVSTLASGIVAVLDADGIAIATPATVANEIPPLAGLTAGGTVSVNVAGTASAAAPDTLLVTGDITGTDVALGTTGTVAGFSGAAVSQSAGTIAATGVEIPTNRNPIFAPGTIQITAASGGISLAGKVITSVPGTATVPAGAVTLTALAGDIGEAANGRIDTATLSGSAGGSGNQNSLPPGNADFAIRAGNTISTLTGFTSSGNFSLEDDTGLVVGTVTATAGSIGISGPTSGSNPSGSLTIAGAVTAASSVSLSNALGIAELANASILSTGAGVTLASAGSISQAGTATITGGEASSAGDAVALTAGTGITLAGTITAGIFQRAGGTYAGQVALSATSGDIGESGGASIRAGTLTGDAPGGNANLAVSAGNTIGALNVFSTSGNFALEDDAGLTIGTQPVPGTLTARGSFAIAGPATGLPAGILVIKESINAGGSVSLGNGLGIAQLSPSAVSSSAGGVTLTSGGGIVQQAGASLAGGVASSGGTALALSAAGSTPFGTDLPGAGLPTVKGLSLSGALTAGTLSGAAFTGLAVLTALDGDILQGTGGSIRAGTLSGSATGSGTQAVAPFGNALFNVASGNEIGTFSGFTATGAIDVESDTGLSIGSLSGGGTITASGPSGAGNPQPSGSLVVFGNVTAPGAILLGNALGITETGAGTIATPAAISLVTGGAIGQQRGGSIASGLASSGGTALSLTAGSVSFAGTLSAGPLASGTYGGIAAFAVGAGGIGEATGGTLRAGTLAGSVSGTGSAQFTAGAGNTVSTLTGFTAGGAFVLEDDAQLRVGSLSAGGSLTVNGPSGGLPAGILSVSGTVQGGGDVTLSNALGIAVLGGSGNPATGGRVVSTGGGVTLTAAQGAIDLPAGSTLSGGAASSAGSALDLTAGGTTDFASALPSSGLATVGGIAFGGTLTAGTLSPAGYTGLASFTATGGGIQEGANAGLLAGTLSATAASAAAPNSPAVDIALSPATGNQLSDIATLSASGNVTVENAPSVLVGNVTAGGSISIAGPTSGGVSGILVADGTMRAGGLISLNYQGGIGELAPAGITSTGGNVSLSTGGAFAQQAGSSVTGAVASSTGTDVSITARGTTQFASFAPAGALGTVAGIALGGTLTAGTVPGLAFLDAPGTGIQEGGRGSLRAGTLSGAATGGDAVFETSAGNSIGLLTGFSSSGSFVLEDDTGLVVRSLAAGTSIDIHGPASALPGGSLTLAGAIGAPGNISLSNAVGITEDTGASVTSTLAGVTLTSSAGLITQQAQATLSGGAASSSGSTAISLTGGSGIDVSGTIIAGTSAPGGTAVLTSSGGDITEGGSGLLQAGTLTGSAFGNAAFQATAGNAVGDLAAFTAGGNFQLTDATALTVTGPLAAGGNVAISAPAGANGLLVIAGSITATGTAAGAGTISLANGLGIIETGAGTADAFRLLQLTSGGAFVQLAGGALSVTEAATAGGTGTISVGAAGQTDFAGTAFATLGTVGGIALGGSVAAGTAGNAAGPFGGAVLLDAGAGEITETAPGAANPTGAIGAASLTANAGTAGGTAYGISLNTVASGVPANRIGTLSGTDASPFLASGAIDIDDNGSVFTLFGGHAVTLQGAMTASGGALTINIYGADLEIAQPGSRPISASGAATFQTTEGPVSNGVTLGGSVIETSGTIAAQDITIAAGGAFSQRPGAVLSTPGTVAMTTGSDGTPLASGIALGGTVTAGDVALAALQGDITEVAQGGSVPTGVVRAGTLSASALAQGGTVALDTTSSASSGNRVALLGAAASSGAFSLVDGEALVIDGSVQAGLSATTPAALTLVAPIIDVTTGSLAIAPPSGTAPGVLSLVADQFSFAAPADVRTPGGIVALDLLNASPANTVFVVGSPGTATISAASLENIRTGSGTVALGSLDGVSASPANAVAGGWGLGTGGSVAALDINAAVDLTGSAGALGLFSNGSISSGAGLTVGALYGRAGSAIAGDGSVLLTGTNAIATLGVQSAGGTLLGFSTQQAGTAGNATAFQLTDSIPLTILGPVAAEQGAVSIAVTGTNGALPGLTIGTALAGSGNMSGTDIDLSAAGSVAQMAGTLDFFGAPHGTLAVQSSGGGISLGGTLVGGGVSPFRLFTLDPASAVLLSAGGGDITEAAGSLLAAGTLAAAANGNIQLTAGANTVNVVAPLSSAAANLSLPGLTASGATGIALTDLVSLLVADGTVISAYGPAGTTGPGTGSVALTMDVASLTIGAATGATIAAPGDITLTAPGGIVQTGGLIASGVDVFLAAGSAQSSGVIVQAGGTITAVGSVTEIAAGPAAGGASIVQTTLAAGQGGVGGVIDAGQDVTLIASDGGLAQTASSITGTNAVTIDVSGAVTQSTDGTIAAPGTRASTSGTVIIASSAGGLALDGLVAGGGAGLPLDNLIRMGLTPGAPFGPAASSAVLLFAGGGDIVQSATGAVDAGTFAAAATGNIALAGGNQVSAINSLSAVLDFELPQTLTLYGLAAGGPAGISLNNFASLQIGPDTGAHAVIDAASPTGALTLNEDGALPGFDSLTIGAAGASSLLAGGTITLNALGAILQDSGTIRSANGGVVLASSEGGLSQTAGSIIAATGVGIGTALDVDQAAGTISAGGSIGIVAGGAFSESLGSFLTAGTGVTVRTGGDIDQSSSVITAGGLVSLASSQGGFTQANASVFGPAGVIVAVAGDVGSTDSVIESTGTATPGLVSITSSTGRISSTGSAALIGAFPAGGPAGAGGNVLLSAAGDITADRIVTGTLAAAAGGSIRMSGANTISAIAATGSFAGLSAVTGNIDLADLVALTASPGATIAAPSGTIAVSAAALSLDTATVTGGGDVTLATAGVFTQTGGLIRSSTGSVALYSQTFSQTAGGAVLAGETVSVAGTSGVSLAGTVQAGTLADGTYTGALSLSAGPGGIAAASGTLLAGTLAGMSGGQMDLGDAGNEIARIGTAGTLVGLSALGSLTLLDAQSLTVAATVAGASGVSFTVSPGGFTENPGLGISGSALAIRATGDISIAGLLDSGTLTLAAGGNLSELAAAGITVRGAGSLASGAATTLDGTASVAGALTAVAGTGFSEGQGALVTAGATGLTARGGTATIAGSLVASGPLTLIAGGDIAEASSGSIGVTGAATIAAGGAAAIDGALSVSGPLGLTAGTDITVAQGALVTAGTTVLDATLGTVSLGGVLTGGDTLAVTAGADIDVAHGAMVSAAGQAMLQAGGAVMIEGVLAAGGPLAISAAASIDEAPGGTIASGASAMLASGGAATIGGVLSAAGALDVGAGSLFTEGGTGSIGGGNTALTAASGAITIDGALTASGSLTLAAGTDVTEGQAGTGALGSITAGATSITATASAVTIDGRLQTSLPLTITAHTGFTEAAGASITGAAGAVRAAALPGAISIAAQTGDAALDGAITTAGALDVGAGRDIMIAGTVADAGSTLVAGGDIFVGGSVASGPTSLTAGRSIGLSGDLTAGAARLSSGGSVAIGGRLTAGDVAVRAGTGMTIGGSLKAGGTLGLTAGTDIGEAAGASIVAATSADLAAPGTITLAGLLASPSILMGAPATRLVVWNGNTIDTGSSLRGRTDALDILAPLTGGQGVFVQSAAFQQIGTAFVDPLTGTTATLQVTVQGKGTAHFDKLDAPRAQLLLNLKGAGFASGLIDVAGLNVYYTNGETPPRAADLFGVVGGKTGTSAAGVGFSHINSNINYQINGCPIQSINCVLLSPLVVPVVDPVTDYAVGTQRKRLQDDDALPNVGEEDY